MSHPFPHHYVVTGSALPGAGLITLRTAGAPPLATTLPTQFDGPGDEWSPEALLVGAIADCYLFTFRGIAAKSNLAWATVSVEVTGTLEPAYGVPRFTEITLKVSLEVPPQGNLDLARRIAARAEATCLITRSLVASIHLEMTVAHAGRVAA